MAQIITVASMLSFTVFSLMIFRFRISTFPFYTIANSASQLKIAFLTSVEPPRKGHFGTNINSSGYRGCPLLRGSNRIFGDLVLSIVERYLIQCPFLGGSSLRGSTVVSVTSCSCLVLYFIKLH